MADKMNTIAVVSKLFSNFFVHEVLQGIEPHLFKGPYEVNYYPTTGRIDIEKDMLKTILYERRADALISISTPMDEDLMQAYKNSGIPVVFIEESCEGGHTVKVDNVKGSFIATEYLIKKGHKKIGVIAGEFLDKRTNSMVIERLIGYRKAIEDYGRNFNEKWVKHVAYYTFEEGKEKMKEFLNENAGLDAVFCAAGDLCAMGAMEELRERNIKVPEDVSIVGYDDILTAQYNKPSLTTVKQPIEQLGSEAFELAVKCITGEVSKDESKLIILDPKFIQRNSA
ncbi:MAG: substrate-binding domain-containing protein [Spirochaetia bacterium]|nr:substrate-binding domain-containing protein [Spirochaetia bacterium]